MNKKKIITVCVLLIVTIFMVYTVAFNYKVTPHYSYTSHPMTMMTNEFNKADNETKFYMTTIKNSTCGVTGVYKTYYVESGLHTWEFELKDIIYGTIVTDKIKVVLTGNDEFCEHPLNKQSFKEGVEYLLLLHEDNSIFLTEPQYGLLGKTVIPLNDVNASTWDRGEISFGPFSNRNSVINYYKDIANERGYGFNKFTIKAFRNETLKNVIESSDAVFKISVVGKVLDGRLVPQTTYEVKITDALKGEEYIGSDSSGYLIHVAKDSLIEGKEYIVSLSLNSAQEKHSSFTQSALNGIIPIEDAETVKNVYEWLDKK